MTAGVAFGKYERMGRTSPAARLGATIVARGLSQREAARQLEIEACTLCLILQEKKLPGRELASAIEAWTDGVVPASAWSTDAGRKRVARVKRRAA